MFPLNEETVLVLCLAGLAGALAATIVYRGPVRVGPAVALLGAGLGWPWPVVFVLGPDGYLLAAALQASLWTAGAVLVGLAWGAAARRVFGGRARLAVVVLPLLLGMAVLLERQRVPAAPCAERALVVLGDLALRVPRALGARSVQADDAPRQDWEGAYTFWDGAKPDTRALCRASDGGRAPLALSHLSMPAGPFHRRLTADCAGTTDTPRPAEICAAADRTALTIVQIHARPDGLPGPTLGLFDRARIVDALEAGERRGLRCNDEVNGPQSRYCSIWQVQPSGSLVLMAARLGPVRDGEDTARDAALLLEAFLSELRPAPAR